MSVCRHAHHRASPPAAFFLKRRKRRGGGGTVKKAVGKREKEGKISPSRQRKQKKQKEEESETVGFPFLFFLLNGQDQLPGNKHAALSPPIFLALIRPEKRRQKCPKFSFPWVAPFPKLASLFGAEKKRLAWAIFRPEKSPKFQLVSFTLTYHATAAKRSMRDKKQRILFLLLPTRYPFLLLSPIPLCPLPNNMLNKEKGRTNLYFIPSSSSTERERESNFRDMPPPLLHWGILATDAFSPS